MTFSKNVFANLIVAILFIAPATEILFGRNPVFNEKWNMYDNHRGLGFCYANFKVHEGEGIHAISHEDILRSLGMEQNAKVHLATPADVAKTTRSICAQYANVEIDLQYRCGSFENWTTEQSLKDVCKGSSL